MEPKRRGRKPKSDAPVARNKKTSLRVQNAIRQNYFDGTTDNFDVDNTEGPVINLILHLPIKSSDVEEGVPLFNSEKFFGKLTQRNGIDPFEGATEPEEEKDIFIEPQPKKKIDFSGGAISNPFLSPYGVKDDGKYTIIEKSSWVKSTGSYCWWCCHPFDNVPCGIPDDYNEANGVFHLYGCFCSFNCCLAYIIQNLDEKKWEKAALLHLLYKKTHNRDDVIIPAMRKELLIAFGGHLTIDEFRNSSNKLDLMDITLPPINSIRPKLEQRNFFQSVSVRNTPTTFPLSPQIEEKKTYRIQRNRPIKEQNEQFIKNFLKNGDNNKPEENNQQGHQQ